MLEYISRLQHGRVLVCGDVMLDKYYFGKTDRISPEGPVPVVNITTEEGRIGGAGNVAVNISSLGGITTLVGYVGRDGAAAAIKMLLSAQKVCCRFLELESVPTVTKLRIISQNQQLLRLDWENPRPNLDVTSLTNAFEDELTNCDVVILSDYAKGTLKDPRPLIAAARAAGKRVIIDPKGTDFSKYAGATLLTPNLTEFVAIVGRCESEEAVIDKARKLVLSLDLEAILITRSEKGMLLVEKKGEPHNFAARAKQVFDVTGAGDTVIGTLALALASGATLVAAVSLANVAAGLVVAKVGTASVSTEELIRELKRFDDTRPQGAIEPSQLKTTLKNAQAAGLTIVFTNGCFDVLHPGHVAYLEEAKALGDRLVVALNDDDSVRRLKGPERPINNLEARSRVIGGLRSVDYVTSFHEDTPERIIKELLPNILVKGGDYQIHEIVGADAVQLNGGKVITLSFVEGCSTTKILEKIKQTQSTAS